MIDVINQKNAEINQKIQLLKLNQEMEKAERLKRKEAEKNQVESDATKKLEMEHKLQQMLKEQQTQNQALMEKLRDANGKAEKYMEICSKCRSDRHRVADCPLNFCKSCGEQGHEVFIFLEQLAFLFSVPLLLWIFLKFMYGFFR